MSSSSLIAHLEERYEIQRVLGSGACGIVYLGLQKSLRRHVAIKAHKIRGSEGSERFLREFKLLSLLRHPCIVGVVDFGVHDETLFMVTTYVEGKTLREELTARGSLSIPEAVGIISSLLAALQHIHGHGIVHRDLKPENIMLTGPGRATVIDFGISFHDSWERLTETGQLLGTPLYMSPEQVLGSGLDGRSDLYSLGLIAHEIIYGKNPMMADSYNSVLARHLNVAVKALPSAPPVPAALAAFILRTLAKKAEDRFQSATDALAQISHLVGISEFPADAMPGEYRPTSGDPGDGQAGRQPPRSSTVVITGRVDGGLAWRRIVSRCAVMPRAAAAFLLLAVSVVCGTIGHFAFVDVSPPPPVQARRLVQPAPVLGPSKTVSATSDSTLSFTSVKGEIPVPRTDATMAYDPGSGCTLLLGGAFGSFSSASFDFWAWDGTHWSRLPYATDWPAPQHRAAMATDTIRQRVLLYGRRQEKAVLWEWDGRIWREADSNPNPGARKGHGLVYDPVQRCAVLAGGGAGDVPSTTLWIWDGKSWTSRRPSGPGPNLNGGAMTYDEARRCFVYFCGHSRTQRDGETWEYSGTRWNQLRVATPPPARRSPRMVYDVQRHRIVLFGGNFRDDTWEFNGIQWMERRVARRPPGRTGHSMAYDRRRHRTVLFGGTRRDKKLGDTWEWDGETWTLVCPE
jgi:hypothetical protein